MVLLKSMILILLRSQNNFIYLHSENECVMELFKGQSLLEFTERFKTDLDCEEYLASLKWEDGYCCRKLRGIYSWVSEFNIDRYLAEYSFRINRSQSKETIFNKLIKRIVERSPVSQSQLVCS